eukprot:4768384-Pyramimonas_sp.AAC.2
MPRLSEARQGSARPSRLSNSAGLSKAYRAQHGLAEFTMAQRSLPELSRAYQEVAGLNRAWQGLPVLWGG